MDSQVTPGTALSIGLSEPDAPGREPSDWHEAEEFDSPEGGLVVGWWR